MSVLSWHGPLCGVSRNSVSTLSHRAEVTETCPGRENQRILRRYLSSDPLLPTVHKRFMISQFKDGLKSKLRSSRSCITLRMSPLGVAPQVSDHGFEGSTIPRPSAIAQGSK